jgi:hypothetical protein
VQYLKAGMQVDVYKVGTDAKRYTLTIVEINKDPKRFTFSNQNITVSDNDEVWLAGTKGTLSRFWNTDSPLLRPPISCKFPPEKTSPQLSQDTARTTTAYSCSLRIHS